MNHLSQNKFTGKQIVDVEETLGQTFNWKSNSDLIYVHRHKLMHLCTLFLVKVTCGQVWWPLLGICALHLTHPKCTHTHSREHTHTHSSEHTHHEHTPGTVNTHTHTAVNTHTHTAVNTHTHTAVNTHTHTQQWTHTHPEQWTHTQSSEHTPRAVNTHPEQWTHTVNTHPEQWAAVYAVVPGEQLWVRCLAQGHLRRGIEGGERVLYIHSLHLQVLPAWDSNSQPFDYESDSLTIMPRLPLISCK